MNSNKKAETKIKYTSITHHCDLPKSTSNANRRRPRLQTCKMKQTSSGGSSDIWPWQNDRQLRNLGRTWKSEPVFTQLHSDGASCSIKICQIWIFQLQQATVAALAYLDGQLEWERHLLIAQLEDQAVVLAELEDQVVVLAELEDQVVVLAELEDQVVVLAELEDQVVVLAELLGCWAAPLVSCPWQAPAKALHMHHRFPCLAASGLRHEVPGFHWLYLPPGGQSPCGHPKGRTKPKSKVFGMLVCTEWML